MRRKPSAREEGSSGDFQTDPATWSSSPIVELLGITKSFPGVVANDDIDLAIYPGETHVLLGENGAGKSTLIGILSGMIAPDAGRIHVRDREVEIDSPRAALEFGIGTVYQHLTLVPTLTVLENLMLGSNSDLQLRFDEARRRFEELADLLGASIDPDVKVASLSLGQQQQVEILKTLWRSSDVLILDEPTSMLTPEGVAKLGHELAQLKQNGLGIVFITHKLHEAIEMGDRVTVLRNGRSAGTIDDRELRSTSSEELKAKILGFMFSEEKDATVNAAELGVEQEHAQFARELPEETALELEEMYPESRPQEPVAAAVSCAVRRGEIFGIAGVDGNGQRQLAEAIAGQRRLRSGDIRLDSVSIRDKSVSERQNLGLRYVTDDRLGEGIVHGLGVGMNMVLKRIGQAPFWRRGRVRQQEINAFAEKLIQHFDIRVQSAATHVDTLSGGNIQKVLLARELSLEPRVVIYNKPTHGLDVKTTHFVRSQIREMAEAGTTAIVISTELEELLELCDRIAVMSRGRLTGIVENGPGAQERIGELMVAG